MRAVAQERTAVADRDRGLRGAGDLSVPPDLRAQEQLVAEAEAVAAEALGLHVGEREALFADRRDHVGRAGDLRPARRCCNGDAGRSGQQPERAGDELRLERPDERHDGLLFGAGARCDGPTELPRAASRPSGTTVTRQPGTSGPVHFPRIGTDDPHRVTAPACPADDVGQDGRRDRANGPTAHANLANERERSSSRSPTSAARTQMARESSPSPATKRQRSCIRTNDAGRVEDSKAQPRRSSVPRSGSPRADNQRLATRGRRAPPRGRDPAERDRHGHRPRRRDRRRRIGTP